MPLDAFPDLREELIAELKSSFIPDLARDRGPSLLIDLAGFVDLTSALRVPVVLDERPVAVLALGWATSAPEPEPAWLATVQRFADHAAVALERARRVEAERDAARLYRRFEASLIPQVGTSASDLRIAVSYSAGERRMRLGGDFVDLVTLADGRVRAVIGDVSGHGPDAAAVGASLRAAWRALAHRDLSAAAAMGTLNELIMEDSDRAEAEPGRMPIMATVCAVELSSDRATATFVTAGHPPALLLAGDETATMPLGGLALGVELCDWTPVTVPLPESWTLLLYTDGIIEAHADPEGAGAHRHRGAGRTTREDASPAGMGGRGPASAHGERTAHERRPTAGRCDAPGVEPRERRRHTSLVPGRKEDCALCTRQRRRGSRERESPRRVCSLTQKQATQGTEVLKWTG